MLSACHSRPALSLARLLNSLPSTCRGAVVWKPEPMPYPYLLPPSSPSLPVLDQWFCPEQARAELAGLPDSNGAPELNPSPEIEEALEAIPDDWSLHASFAVACLSVIWFWCQADTPSLSRKLASAIFFPVGPHPPLHTCRSCTRMISRQYWRLCDTAHWVEPIAETKQNACLEPSRPMPHAGTVQHVHLQVRDLC